ncbi:MAG: hypothetical protein J5857_07915 [Treponema sp.]|nr:hypothetical protein [Treponema sp.]
MKIRKLLVLFLIPVTLFFVSCENEIPEEFQIELSENMSMNGANLDSILEQVDYFKLNLFKVFEYESVNGPTVGYSEVFFDLRLNKGDILRLDGLEPGLYELTGNPYRINEYGEEEQSTYNVTRKSNKMATLGYYEYIVVDEDSPTIVRLVISPT